VRENKKERKNDVKKRRETLSFHATAPEPIASPESETEIELPCHHTGND